MLGSGIKLCLFTSLGKNVLMNILLKQLWKPTFLNNILRGKWSASIRLCWTVLCTNVFDCTAWWSTWWEAVLPKRLLIIIIILKNLTLACILRDWKRHFCLLGRGIWGWARPLFSLHSGVTIWKQSWRCANTFSNLVQRPLSQIQPVLAANLSSLSCFPCHL